jgi:predicted DNA binding protein
MSLTNERLDKIKKEAYDEGLNDTIVADILAENALLFINSNVEEELTDEEKAVVIQAYCQGFISGE